MPEAMERELKKTAKKRGYGEKRTGAYVYGTMRKTGWKPSHEKKKKNNPSDKAKDYLKKKGSKNGT